VIFPPPAVMAKCEYGAFEGAEKPPPVGEAIAQRSVGEF
jgi:hypothetical protein